MGGVIPLLVNAGGEYSLLDSIIGGVIPLFGFLGGVNSLLDVFSRGMNPLLDAIEGEENSSLASNDGLILLVTVVGVI